jgi:hypothetical protein
MTQPLLAHPIRWTSGEAWEFGDESRPNPGAAVLIQLDGHICFGVFDLDDDGWIASEVDEPLYFSLLFGKWAIPEGTCLEVIETPFYSWEEAPPPCALSEDIEPSFNCG